MKQRIALIVSGLASIAALPALAESVVNAPDLGAVQMTVQIGAESFSSGIDFDLKWSTKVDAAGNTRYVMWGDPVVLKTLNGSTLSIGNDWFDPDPVLSIAGSATNSGSTPLAFSFTFNAPMSPALTGNIASSAILNVGLTDVNGDGAVVAPLAGDTFMLHSSDAFGSGAGSGSISKNVDVGTSLQIAAGAFPVVSQIFSQTSSLNCVIACTVMSARMSFLLSAGDNMSFNGVVTQTQVPLPAGIWLLGSGALSLLGLRRRRSNA